MVGHGAFSGAANSRSLTDVHSRTLLFDYKDANGVTDWSNDQHVTLYADDESWATMGLFYESNLNETGAYDNEIMQYSTTDPLKFRRLLHHRSHYKNTSATNGYWAAPKPTISRDGRFIAFTSNWEDSGRYDLFIAKIDPPGQSSTPVDVTWTNVSAATASGSSLTATAAGGRGESAQSITSGNGSVKVTVANMGDSGNTYVGLINGSFTGGTETGYGWKVYNGLALCWVNGYTQGYALNSFISTASGDTYEVKINGTSVEWYRNNSLVLSVSGQTLAYPYRAAARFSETTSPKITNAQLTGAN